MLGCKYIRQFHIAKGVAETFVFPDHLGLAPAFVEFFGTQTAQGTIRAHNLGRAGREERRLAGRKAILLTANATVRFNAPDGAYGNGLVLQSHQHVIWWQASWLWHAVVLWPP